MQYHRAKSEKVGCAPYTVPLLASCHVRSARHNGHCLFAFTLIELLVVISIIALLMAVLMPTLQRVRKQAQATGCQARLRQWAVYYSTYTSEYDGKLPRMQSESGEGFHLYAGLVPGVLPLEFFSQHGGQGKITNYSGLHGYKKLLLCPGTSRKSGANPNPVGYWNGSTHSPWSVEGWSPEDPIDGPVSSYGQNGWTSTDMVSSRDTRYKQVWVRCVPKGADNVPVYSDSRSAIAWAFATDTPPACEDEMPADGSLGMWIYAMDRHGGGINALFMDWSVRKVGVKELWTLKWCPNFRTTGPWTKAGGV